MIRERVHNAKEARALIKEAVHNGDIEKYDGTEWKSHSGEYLFHTQITELGSLICVNENGEEIV